MAITLTAQQVQQALVQEAAVDKVAHSLAVTGQPDQFIHRQVIVLQQAPVAVAVVLGTLVQPAVLVAYMAAAVAELLLEEQAAVVLLFSPTPHLEHRTLQAGQYR